jgi:hypothetical protein
MVPRLSPAVSCGAGKSPRARPGALPGLCSAALAGALAGALLLLASCSGRLGWGVLLWSSEEPAIFSGTVLPVYIRSNINGVWVLGIPAEYREGKDGPDKFEVPLSHFELAGSKRKAEARAQAMGAYRRTYAENLQDGLPIRSGPDNSAQRVYRLKGAEIIKVLAKVEGAPAVGASGDPLPGDWYQVMTDDGTAGYCFSYRLKLFEHNDGPLVVETGDQGADEDPDLDRALALAWSAESYGAMVNSGRFDVEELSRHWGFFPGQDTGIARVYVSGLDQTFSYTGIRALGNRTWRFEGTSLQMSLRSDTTLVVQFTDQGGALRTQVFVALATEPDDLIVQENARREELFRSFYEQGPVFTSNNYGTLALSQDGTFNWTGNRLLIPQVIPAGARQGGTLAMDLYLSAALRQRYEGALSMYFDGAAVPVRFMYIFDTQGLRIEFVPETSMDGNLVARRASSPIVIYFYRAAL